MSRQREDEDMTDEPTIGEITPFSASRLISRDKIQAMHSI